jgi:hypothetical protein
VKTVTPEPFVSAEEAVKFVPVTRRHLLALARRGITGAYPLDSQARRKRWVFRLSELTGAIAKQMIHNPREVCDPAPDLGGPR